MEKNYFIQLTLLLYQTTESFSQEELLKLKIRNLADNVLADLILINPGEAHKDVLREKDSVFCQTFLDIDDLNEYLTMARTKNLLERDNFLFIRQEYSKIKEEIKKSSKDEAGKIKEEAKSEERKKAFPPLAQAKLQQQPRPRPKPEKEQKVLKERQKKILKILEKEKSAQVCDFQKFLPEVSKRTLRRDLDGLLKHGLVVRVGQWNEVFYKLSN